MITCATQADLETVWSLLVAAAQWVESQGITQWTHYLDGSGRAELVEAVDQGEVYLCWQDGRPVGTISLQMAPSEWDRQVWGEVGPDEAAYVHRFAVAREAAGTGVGDRMLDWAAEAARGAGRRYLRLDCITHNEGLNRYYAKRFTSRGRAPNIGLLFQQYEKAL